MDWKWLIAHLGMFGCQIAFAFIISLHFEDLFPKKKRKAASSFMFALILFLGMLFTK